MSVRKRTIAELLGFGAKSTRKIGRHRNVSSRVI